MQKIDESNLSELLSKDVNLRFVEPQIYSVITEDENTNFFDRIAWFYDVMICNPLYNRLVWGYSVESYHSLTQHALASSEEGWVLDAGCGSLAFSARTYIKYAARPVVFSDYSLNLLRIAKSRLIKLNGAVPDNMVFLQCDALQLPFRPKCFKTIVSLNLLHILDDLDNFLLGLMNVLAEKGTMSFTTLIKNNRCADKYLEKMLKKAGGAAPRNIDQLRSVFNGSGIYSKCEVNGNMAFICCG